MAGALLVAPPCVENFALDGPPFAFAPLVREHLQFPSILAGRNDEYASFGHSRKMARLWGSRFVDAGWTGHINAESGLGSWPYGEFLLDRLMWSLGARQPDVLSSTPRKSSIQSTDISPGL